MSAAVGEAFARFSSRWPSGRAVTLVLVGPHSIGETRSIAEACVTAGVELHDHSAERPADLVERLGAAAFDYAHVGHEWGSMGDVERLTCLRVAERLARAGLFWTGTLRGITGGPGTSRRRVVDARARLSMGWLEGRLPRLGGAFCLAGEHADAWSGLGIGGPQPDTV